MELQPRVFVKDQADPPEARAVLGGTNSFARNPDGSFTFFVQRDDPGPDKRANWLPAPTGPFYVILRDCAPVAEVVEGLKSLATFKGPPGLRAARWGPRPPSWRA